MPRKDDDWKKEAILETIRRHAADPAVNNKEFARQIWGKITANEDEVKSLLALTGKEATTLKARLEDPEDAGIYALLDNMAKKGYGAGPVNMKLLNWFVDNDPMFKKQVEQAYEQIRIKRTYPEVFILQEQFDDKASGQVEFVKFMHGEYVLYRPFYYDLAGRVMRLRLTIGKPDNPFYVTLEHRYDASEFFHGMKEYTFEGLVVPLPDRKSAVINLRSGDKSKATGNQLLYVDFMSPHTGKTFTMTGVALGAVGSLSPASAWPFYVRRLNEDEEFEPDVILRSAPEISADIEKKLALGAVSWK